MKNFVVKISIVLIVMISSMTNATYAQNDCRQVARYNEKIIDRLDKALQESTYESMIAILSSHDNETNSIKRSTGPDTDCNCIDVNFAATDIDYGYEMLLRSTNKEMLMERIKAYIKTIEKFTKALVNCRGN